MRRWAHLILCLAGFFLGQSEAGAQGFIRFTCNIAGFDLRDAGPVAIHGTGSLLLSQNSLHYDLSIPLREDYPEAAHFHGPAVGADTPIIPLAAFTRVAGGIHYSGVIQVPVEFMPDLLAGRWYVNLHSSAYQAGVLSGFVVPASAPEPGVLGLLVAGGAVLAVCRKISLSKSV